MSKLQIPTADVFLPFLENREARNHAARGGRGGMKSHYFAGALIEEHLCTGGFRSVCIREIQKTLGSSSKQLLEDKLREFKLTRAGQGFKIFNDVIQTPQEGLILFQGMQDHTADSIKSLEGMDLAWVEEAQTITERSLNMLRPTIRKKGSRLWFGWNPRRKTDAVDKFFCSAEKPSNSIILKTGWQHNPWWTAELEQERLDDLRINPDQYDHIWEGGYISIANGAYFAKHLQQARLEGRIGKVNVDPLLRKYVFVDIGGTGASSDAFTMWVVQFVAKEIRVIHYYEVVGQPLAAHVTWLRVNHYEDAIIVLPHDGRQHDKVYKVTYESSFKDLGFTVIVIPNQGAGAANQRIEAVRQCFHDCYFDELKCAAGLEALGWYHEKKDANRNVGLGAEHDWSSHGCLIAGTMINTSRGLIAIEDVLIGDEVMTPAGLSKVDNSGISKISTELIEVTLSDGRHITMTPEHKVFTTKGVCLADTLGYGDSIFTIEGREWIQLANASNVGYRDAFIENLKELGIGTGKKEDFFVPKMAENNGFCIGIAARVVKVRRFIKEIPVYDLTVRKHRCYFANGMLVSNSDAFGLMAITRNKLSKPRDTRKIQVLNNAPSDSIAGY